MRTRKSKIDFTGSSGTRLAGLLEVPASQTRAYVLFAHCFTCGKDNIAASRISRALVARYIKHCMGKFASKPLYSSN